LKKNPRTQSLRISKKQNLMRILCTFGFHAWNKKKGYNNWSSHVIEYSAHCQRCGKIKTWIETKPTQE